MEIKNNKIAREKKGMSYLWVALTCVIVLAVVAFFVFNRGAISGKAVGQGIIGSHISVEREITYLYDDEDNIGKKIFAVDLHVVVDQPGIAVAAGDILSEVDNVVYWTDPSEAVDSNGQAYDLAMYDKVNHKVVYKDESGPISTTFSYLVSANEGDSTFGDFYFIDNDMTMTSESITGDTIFTDNAAPVHRLRGDANDDGVVDLQDFGALKDCFAAILNDPDRPACIIV